MGRHKLLGDFYGALSFCSLDMLLMRMKFPFLNDYTVQDTLGCIIQEGPIRTLLFAAVSASSVREHHLESMTYSLQNGLMIVRRWRTGPVVVCQVNILRSSIHLSARLLGLLFDLAIKRFDLIIFYPVSYVSVSGLETHPLRSLELKHNEAAHNQLHADQQNAINVDVVKLVSWGHIEEIYDVGSKRRK
jgi:hypothetical protein